MKSEIPGVKSFHRIITDSCRKRNGVEIEEVMAGVNKAIDDLYRYWPEGKDVKIHIAVSVEYFDQPNPAHDEHNHA